MEKYSRVLIIIFFLCLFNLSLNLYLIVKKDNEINKTQVTTQVSSIVSPTPKPTLTTKQKGQEEPVLNDMSLIKSDVTLIKAEIRALRELLGTTRSFEELSKLINELESKP